MVDDDPQIRRVLRVTLTKSGYEVLDARSGEEALLRLRDSQPDLILLDMNLSGMNGLETCREIRRSFICAHHYRVGERLRQGQGKCSGCGRR